MPTINQLVRKGRQPKRAHKRWHILSEKPQIKGVCAAIKIITPKKPNSACRKVARVRLNINGQKKMVYAYIPGEGHTLQEYSSVLVRGGSPNDLPGVNNTLVRGSYDFKGVVKRKTSRSVYGTRKPS